MSQDGVVIVSSHLPGEAPLTSDRYRVLPVECKAELSYWHGLAEAWSTDDTVVNVEHDMEFSDNLVQGLLDCPHPACMYPYQVYPTAMRRFIYCATTTSVAEAEWAEYREHMLRVQAELAAERPVDEDCLIVESPDVGTCPAWQQCERCKALGHHREVKRRAGLVTPRWVEQGDEWAEWASIGFCKVSPEARTLRLDMMFWQWLEHSVNRVVSSSGLRWHLHWPEIKHYHDYKQTPDHLW